MTQSWDVPFRISWEQPFVIQWTQIVGLTIIENWRHGQFWGRFVRQKECSMGRCDLTLVCENFPTLWCEPKSCWAFKNVLVTSSAVYVGNRPGGPHFPVFSRSITTRHGQRHGQSRPWMKSPNLWVARDSALLRSSSHAAQRAVRVWL